MNGFEGRYEVWMSMDMMCAACGGKLKIPFDATGAAACPHCQTAVSLPDGGLAPGETLGGFRIERMIGEGGMGRVYLAHQLSLGRDVALKVLPACFSATAEAAGQFMNEVRVLALLDHPNIVTVHEAGEEQGMLFMAMAYVRGQTLAERLETRGRIPETTALRLARDMADALRYAWSSHRLLHRDVKPSNILLPARGLPQLADFGIAVSLAGARRGSDGDGDDIRGTPNYMSPEQAGGESNLDPRSDMYALGATVYHAVTGQMPYRGVAVEKVLRLQRSQCLPDPRSHAAALSRPCAALLARMLAKDRAQRHPTWEALIADIRRVLSGDLPKEGDTHLVSGAAFRSYAPDRERARRQRVRRRVAATGASLIALLALGWVVRAARAPRANRVAHGSGRANVETQAPAPSAGGLEQALAYGRAYPADFDGQIDRFQAVMADASDRRVSDAAAAELRRVRSARHAAIQRVVLELERETLSLVDAGRLDEAVLRWRAYNGLHADISAAARERRADALLEQAASRRAAQASASRAEREALARETLGILLASIGLPSEVENPSAVLSKIAALDLDEQRARSLREGLEAFRLHHGDTVTAFSWSAVLAALSDGVSAVEGRRLR